METHKLEEEAIEVMEQDTDQMTVSQFRLSRRNSPDSDSPHMIKLRKSFETKKRRSSLTHKIKQGLVVRKVSLDETLHHLANSSDLGKSVSYTRRGALVDPFYDDSGPKSPVLELAEAIQANLAPEFPSFIKTIRPSHVTGRFMIRLPKEFCCLHLPPHDTTVHLVDESGEEYIVDIHVERVGRCQLRSGWKYFSIANKLLVGDVLVFQLVNSSKLKVYIVRENGLTEGDGALGILNLNARANQLNLVCEKWIIQPLLMDIVQENIQQESPMILKSNQSEIHSEGLGSETADFLVDLSEIGRFESFTISLNGSNINSEVSEYHRTKYYELCCSQNSVLHRNLLETITCKLAAALITQTVNIADAIRACNLSTSRADYSTWNKTLEGLELFGMDVGFLRAKISRVLTLALESEKAVNLKRVKEAQIQQSCPDDEIKTLELKLLDLKRAAKKLDLEIETLKGKMRGMRLCLRKRLMHLGN